MALNLADVQAQDTAWGKQYDEQQAAEKAQANPAPPSFLERWTAPIGRATMSAVDSAVSAADSMYDSPVMRKARDVVAGGITGVTNIADSAVSLAHTSGDEPDENGGFSEQAMQSAPTSPIWDHAKQNIMDFRDAVAVSDPSLADNLTQSVAQLAIPFAGYSRALAGLHGLADTVASGLLTDSTALEPHAMRTADLIALGQHTEGKLGEALRWLGPHGLNAYVNFLTDRGNETEAEGRFKNALDGLGANLIAVPLLHAAGVVLKQGTAGLRYMVDNGVGSAGDLGPPSIARQAGKIVFHGTPHDFDAFDNSKIGTGQGAQSYGHGLYFAEDPATAGHYRELLTRQSAMAQSALSDAHNAIQQTGGPRQALETLNALIGKEKDAGARSRMQQAADMIKSGNYKRGTGALMHVEIPDEHIDNMLDWDKPLSEQPAVVKNLQKIGSFDSSNEEQMALTGKDVHQRYEQLGFTPQGIAGMFGEAGIPGIKYLDRGSRGTGEGTRNIVLFDAKHAKIVKKE